MNTHSTDLVRKGRKYDQVLEGAHQVFMAEGYEGANVDAIAKAACVSKATLYSYFPDKRALFAAVAQAACQEQTRLSMSFAHDDGSLSDKLFRGCRSFMAFMYSPFGLQMFRTVMSEAARFPEFGRAFWATGPQMAHSELVAVFRTAVECGQLKAGEDLNLAAETLTELCKVYLHSRLMLGVLEKPDPADLDRIAHHAVETFMARYGT